MILDHAESRGGEPAVGTTDAGLLRLLNHAGATLAYQPGERYVVVTTADRRTLTFALGERRYLLDGVKLTASFAPYAENNEAFVPLFALARALYILPVSLDSQTVLQPQLGALNVRNVGHSVVVTLRGATPLRYRRTSAENADRVELSFPGVASTLDQSRIVGMRALSQITMVVSGTPRAPMTTVTFEGPAGGVHLLEPSSSPNELAIAFAPRGTALAGAPIPAQGETVAAIATPAYVPEMSTAPSAAATVAPQAESHVAAVSASTPIPQASAAGAQITQITETPAAGGALNLHIGLTGAASYEWHRLLDGRWYIDVSGASSAVSAREETVGDIDVRIKQIATAPVPMIRLAMTLPSMRRVSVKPSANAIDVAVSTFDDADAARSGTGEAGPGVVLAAAAVDPTPQPAEDPTAAPPWKFGARGNASNVIVIDPGHGGSDTGAQGNGLIEKAVTLDVSQRLRDLLTARGWTVKMTRTTDVDVYQPNDSAHDELQARCDVANAAGARLFVSIHVNSFTSSALNGTTTYYFKDDSLPLAQAIHKRFAGTLETQDDGIRKANFYVIRRTEMPAVLVETAFLSNPDDAVHLRSPEFLEKIARDVADGIGDYVGSSSPSQTSMEDR